MKDGKRLVGFMREKVAPRVKLGATLAYQKGHEIGGRVAASAGARYDKWKVEHAERAAERKEMEEEARKIYQQALANERARIRAESQAIRYADAERRAIEKARQPGMLARIGKVTMSSLSNMGRDSTTQPSYYPSRPQPNPLAGLPIPAPRHAAPRQIPNRQPMPAYRPSGLMDFNSLLPRAKRTKGTNKRR